MELDLQAFIKALALAFVGSTMLGVGLSLSLRALVEPMRDVRQMALALVASFVLVPAIAVAIVGAMRLDPAIRAALLLLATVPGGSALIKFVAVAKADQALAASLIVTLMLGSIVYQPLVLPLLIEGTAVSPASIASTLVTTVLLPLVSGLVLRARWPRLSDRIQPPAAHISNISTALLLILLPIANFDTLKAVVGTSGIAAAVLFIVGAIVVGWAMGGPRRSHRRVQAMCCAQGNYAAAFVVATRDFSDSRVAIMLLMLMLVSMAILTPLAIAFGSRETSAVRPG